MYSTESYLDTFCPAVKQAYVTDIDGGYAYYHLEGTTIDDWVAENASYVFKNRTDIPCKLRLELRPIWGTAGGASVFILPEVSPAAFSQLLSSLDAQDIVSIDGFSIINATRMEIAKRGPEFFVVPQDGKFPTDFPISPAYLADRDSIMKAFMVTLYNLSATHVAKAIAMVQTRDQVRKLYRTLPQVLDIAINEALMIAHVSTEGSSVRYGVEDFSTLMHSECPKHRFHTPKADFAVLMKKHIRNHMIGEDITIWTKRDMPEVGRTIEGAEETVRFDVINRKLTNALKQDRKHPFKNLFQSLNDIETGNRNKRRRRTSKPHAGHIGSSIWDTFSKTCGECDDFECEDGKDNRRVGMLLEFTNPSQKCPRTMFGDRMRRDQSLRQCVRRMTSVSKKNSPTDITAVMICPSGELFSPEKHMFSMKVINQNMGVKGLAGTPLIDMNKQVKYRVIGNRIVSHDNSSVCIEHTDHRIPNALFLLPIL